MKLGTYAVEQDYSQYVAKASEVVLAIVGTAKKGPIGVPTVCTSILDFVNKFGNLHPDCLGLYAGQYFLNQSSKIYYVRAASDSATKATVSIAGTDAGTTPITDAFGFRAKTEGSSYNGYKLIVSNVGPTAFDLTVKNASGFTIESITEIPLSSMTTTVESVIVANADAIASQHFEYYSTSATAVSAITAGEYMVSGGTDGISDILPADYLTAGQSLLNDNYEFNLVSVPGVSDPSVVHGMLTIAETRGDCLYLVDSPNNLTSDDVVAWHNGEGNYEHTMFNSSYGALYWSWQIIYDSVNKINVTIPPSVVVAPVLANSARLSEIWYAPAGLQRGIISGVLKPVVAPTSGERDNLYTGRNSINCIINDSQVGLCVFGQKTLSRQDTALNRVNVRMLLNYLKRVIVAACRHLTFEPNDRVTWNAFEDKIEPTLRGIKDHRGIYEYKIVKGESIVSNEDIDNYRMPCRVMIRPTKAAEEIPIYFTITSTGADFNDVLESNGVIVEDY